MAVPVVQRSLRRNRDFVILVTGQVVSFVGSQVQMFAMPLLVLAISGSATQAGLVLGLGTVTWFAAGLIAGVLVDRWDRKKTMILCDLSRAVVILSVPVALWLHALSVAQLCAVAVVNGLLTTFFDSADSASLPNVVPPEQLPAAMGAYESAVNGVRIVGSLIAGALYALGRAIPFLVDAVSFVCSAVSLRFSTLKFQQERAEGEREDTPRELIAEIRQGLGWLRRQRLIRFLVLVSAGDSLRYGAGYLVIITLAQRIGASAAQIGFIFTGAAIGAMLGSLVSSRVTESYSLGHIAIVMLWVEALMFPIYAFAPDLWLLGAVAAAESVVGPIYGVAMSSYQQAITPDELRGRTTSAVNTLMTGAMSLGAMLSGVLIASLGARSTALLLAAWLFLLAVMTTVNRTVRQSSATGK